VVPRGRRLAGLSTLAENQIVATEMFRDRPWPFEGGAFPKDLGAVVQQTVLDGSKPARLVVHTEGGGWAIGDGLNDPNLPGASIATHIWHAIERNSSVASLAGLPPGHEANRSEPGDPWVRT
jgi:hypothetical protein